jgi:type IV secretory pathway VirB6-like protein
MVNDILPIAATFVLGCIQLLVIITGSNMLAGSLDQATAVRRIVTCLIVSALMTPALFNEFVTPTLTQTIPNQISSAIGGAQGLQGAQGFDALVNQITKFAAQAQAQMVGLPYIGDWVVLGIAEIFAKCFLAVCFAIWAMAALSVDFIVPLRAILAPFYLFNATRGFAERGIGKVVSPLLVQTIALMVGATVIKAEAGYMQQFAVTVAAAPANQGFSMNVGQLSYTGASDVIDTTPQAGASTINTAAAIESMIGMVISLAFGLFLLVQTTRIAPKAL